MEAEYTVTRDELLAMGCEERKGRKGAKLYWLNEVLLARECTKCGVIKNLRSFYKQSNGIGGVLASCKKCKDMYTREYFKDRPEERAKYNKNYQNKHHEKKLTTQSNYRARHKLKIQESSKIYYVENKNRILTRTKKWHRSNPKARVLAMQIRRARIGALPVDIDADKLEEIKGNFGGACALSDETTDIHIDHVIPIKIGHGGSTYGNTIPLSAALNRSKNAQHIFEWFDANRERFGLSQRKFDDLIEYLAQVNEMTTQEYRAYVDWCFDNPRDINDLETEESE